MQRGRGSAAVSAAAARVAPVSFGVVLQALLSGLSSGAVLALVALGFTLVAGTVRVLHLAHGDLAVAAVLTGVLGVLGTAPVAATLGAGGSAALVGLALVAGAGLSALVALLAVAPALPDPATGREADPLGWVAGGVAAGLLLREVLGLLLPAQATVVPDPFRLQSLVGPLGLPGGERLPAEVLPVLVLGLASGLAAERLLVRSRFGRSLRAVADDPDAAALCGVHPRRVLLLAFACAGLLAGLAGLLYGSGRAVQVDDGVVLGLSGAAAALLGGLGSLRGALVGGLLLGVVQSLVVVAFGGRWSDLVPLGALVAVLAVRPEGLRRRAAAVPV